MRSRGFVDGGRGRTEHAEVSKYTRNLPPASRAILLSGPAELYQQMLANTLAHYFEAKLLLLDATGFSLKIQSKYGTGNKESPFKRSPSESALEQLSGFLGSVSIYPQKEEFKGTLRKQRSGVDISSWGVEGSCHPCKLRRNASVSSNMDNIISQSNSSNNPGPLKHSQIYLLACIGRDTLLVCSQIYLELLHWMVKLVDSCHWPC